jgi:hypothetical protein
MDDDPGNPLRVACTPLPGSSRPSRSANPITENENKVPAAALWLTNIVVQLFVISTYWSNDAFTLMLNLTSVMSLIPFFLVAAYALLLVRRGETYEIRPQERTRDMIVAGISRKTGWSEAKAGARGCRRYGVSVAAASEHALHARHHLLDLRRLHPQSAVLARPT